MNKCDRFQAVRGSELVQEERLLKTHKERAGEERTDALQLGSPEFESWSWHLLIGSVTSSDDIS